MAKFSYDQADYSIVHCIYT